MIIANIPRRWRACAPVCSRPVAMVAATARALLSGRLRSARWRGARSEDQGAGGATVSTASATSAPS